jgi:hypothetical protein
MQLSIAEAGRGGGAGHSVEARAEMVKQGAGTRQPAMTDDGTPRGPKLTAAAPGPDGERSTW